MKEVLEKIYAGLEPYSHEAERYGGILCRMVAEEITDFSDTELARVFEDCVAPRICINRAKEMQKQYAL